jgi:putative hydrolase of the HAD superfamily
MADPLAAESPVVWCDFGGVLTPPIDEAIEAIVAASGIPWLELRAAADAVAARLGLRGLEPLELGLMSQADWGARLADELAPRLVPRVDLGRWGDYWYAGREVNSELLGELRRLAERGARIGLLTNSVLEWEPHRARMLDGLTPFAAEVRSHELGIAKPDPRIFAHADTILPPGGARVVFIDDLERNCAAAELHGWSAVHHVQTRTTLAALRAASG